MMDVTWQLEAPANSLLVPDIYNKLDADAIEKARVPNSILDIRLGVEQKVIAKYKRQAERFRKTQIEQVAKDLTRISQRMPRGLKQRPIETDSTHPQRHRKGYMTEKSDEMICYRCYVHHLPTKKKFYRNEAPSASPDKGDDPPQSPVKAPPDGEITNSPHLQEELLWEGRTPTSPTMKLPVIRVIAPIERYRFLERDSCGRDKDLNDTLTPRLMPYEGWKQVVHNVCSQCKREVHALPKSTPSRLSRRETTRLRSRERTNEKLRDRISGSCSRRGRSRLSSSGTSVLVSSSRSSTRSPSKYRRLQESENSDVPSLTHRQGSDITRPLYHRTSSKTRETTETSFVTQKESSYFGLKNSNSNMDEGYASVSEKLGTRSPSKTLSFGRTRSTISGKRD